MFPLDCIDTTGEPIRCVDCGHELDGFEGDGPPKCDECATPETGQGSRLVARFAENFIELQEAGGMSNETLGDRSGVAVSEVYALGKGKREPTVTTALRLAYGLGVGLGKLADGIFWNPGEVAQKNGPHLERRPDGVRLRGFFSIRQDGDTDAAYLPGRYTLPPIIGTEHLREEIARRIAENIVRIRQRAGLSQEEVADRSLLHRNAIGKLERGTGIVQLDTLVKLAGGLGIRADELLAGVEWRPPAQTNPPSLNGRQFDYEEIVRMWHDGLTAREIAEALNTTRRTIATLINRLRDEGWDFPYRRPPPRAKDATVRDRRPLITDRQVRARRAWVEPADRDIAARIGANTRRHRTVAGLSLTQFSEATETDRSYLSNVERGKMAHMSLATVLKLAGSAKVAPDMIVEGVRWDVKRQQFRVVLAAETTVWDKNTQRFRAK
jgi:transcriptional regulator with XRE-family HTH domain